MLLVEERLVFPALLGFVLFLVFLLAWRLARSLIALALGGVTFVFPAWP